MYLGVKKVGLFTGNFLTKTASAVESLNTTQHNTTQHIEETLSTTINLSGTRPAWNSFCKKFPAGLFLLNHFVLVIFQQVLGVNKV